MNAELHLVLGRDRAETLRAEAQRDREARAVRPRQDRPAALPDLLARLHLRVRPRLT